MKKAYSIIVILIISFQNLFSQTTALNFRRDEGIRITYPGRLICLFQDSNGFMWMGTQNGFLRFDGYSFTKYNSDLRDSNTVCGPQIRLFNEDNFGNLFIATRSGLSIYSMKQDRFTNYFHDPNDESSLSSNYIKPKFLK